MFKNKLLKLSAALFVLVFSHSAFAIVVTQTGEVSGGSPGGIPIYQAAVDAGDVGDSFNLSWYYDSGDDIVAASATFTITEYDVAAGHFDLDISLTNDSVVAGDSVPRITSFGLNVSPDLTVSSVIFGAGNALDQYDDTGTNFPGFQTIDLCFFADGCSGGNINNGLASGDTDTFSIHMWGDLSQGVILSEFALKFQGIDSYELPGQSVPAPGAAILLGLGLIGLVGMRKKIS